MNTRTNTAPSIPDLARAARLYSDRFGLSTFPAHSPAPDSSTGCDCNFTDCTNQGKHPRTRNGVDDATTDLTRIETWWRTWPHANVAIACGGATRLLVLDVDPKHGGDESLHELERQHGELPRTPTADTGGGGEHYYMTMPEGANIRNSVGTLAAGLDVRTAGGFVIAPPSIHISGGIYTWQADAHISDVPIATVPSWLAELLMAQAAQLAPHIDGPIPKGGRDATLASFAGTMRRRGISEAGILACLEVENETRCDPPLPDSDVQRIARSISRYRPADTAITRRMLA